MITGAAKNRANERHRYDLTDKQIELFWEKVDISSGDDCWLWTGAINHQRGGYGYFSTNRISFRAHILAYTMAVGRIPPGLVLDHLCRTPACVRPIHLEPVAGRENTARGRAPGILRAISRERATATHCKRGHELTEENTVVLKRHTSQQQRCCKPCLRAAQYAHMAKKRAAKRIERLANPRPPKTHCKNGHEFAPENIYIRPGGSHRECLTCRRECSKRSAHKENAA